MSLAKAKKKHKARSKRAQSIDEKRIAKLAKDYEQWMKHPNRYDIRGIDTPQKGKPKFDPNVKQPFLTHEENLKDYYWGEVIKKREKGKGEVRFKDARGQKKDATVPPKPPKDALLSRGAMNFMSFALREEGKDVIITQYGINEFMVQSTGGKKKRRKKKK